MKRTDLERWLRAHGAQPVAGRSGGAHEAWQQAIRSGLADAGAPSEPYRMNTSPMRAKPGIDLTKALRLAGQLEDEEIARKLEQGR